MYSNSTTMELWQGSYQLTNFLIEIINYKTLLSKQHSKLKSLSNSDAHQLDPKKKM